MFTEFFNHLEQTMLFHLFFFVPRKFLIKKWNVENYEILENDDETLNWFSPLALFCNQNFSIFYEKSRHATPD